MTPHDIPVFRRLDGDAAPGTSASPPPLVVGVDGSADGSEVIDWAIREADLRGTRLVLVHAWQAAADNRVPYAPVLGQRAEESEEAAAQRTLGQAAQWVRVNAPSVPVQGALARGMPIPVLLRQADNAALLVLGRRRRHDAALSALGPVTRGCVRQAACPVTVATGVDIAVSQAGPLAVPV